MASLHTTVGGVALECCIYNASGPRTGSIEALAKIGSSRAGAVLSKSATLQGQDGNPLPRYKEMPLGSGRCVGSINSEGLPNKGINYYISDAAVAAGADFGKPYILSISGLSLANNLEMLSRAATVPLISAIELNLACPNLPDKPIIAYDFGQLESVLTEVHNLGIFVRKPLGIKLPPYFDMPHFKECAAVLNKFPIKFVTCTNTIGNALVVDWETEQPLIAPKGGFGGLAGGFIKHTALANVKQMRQLLRPEIDVVGVGGVCSGKDAFEHILCGATAVQVGTCHWTEGASCFDRIARELETIMLEKGYKTIDEFRGKLRAYEKARANKKLTFSAPVAGDFGSIRTDVLAKVIALLLAIIAALIFDRMT